MYKHDINSIFIQFSSADIYVHLGHHVGWLQSNCRVCISGLKFPERPLNAEGKAALPPNKWLRERRVRKLFFLRDPPDKAILFCVSALVSSLGATAGPLNRFWGTIFITRALSGFELVICKLEKLGACS